MGSIRRYGPSMVAPEVMPRPQLGQGAEATFGVFESTFSKVNDFIRPAVVRHQEARGEAEALENIETTGPQFELEQTRGPGNVAIEAVEGRPARTGMAPTVANAAILRASEANGVDPLAMSVIAQIESSGDPNAQNPNSSAGGLFQFIDSTAQQYGLTNRFDPDQASDAGARLMRDNSRTLFSVLGRQPTIGELYLAHQQGAGGASALLRNPNGLAVDTVGHDVVTLNGGNASMTNQQFANIWINKANAEARRQGGTPSIAVNMPTAAEYELRQTNASSFEPRQPFTVRDQAFNAAADRVIQSRAMVALDQGLAAAQQKADGDLEVLRQEMQKVRETVLGGLPDEMPGLRTSLEQTFARSAGVAENQAIALAQRRVVAQQGEAMTQAVSAIEGEAQRLALTGASGQDIAAHLTGAQAALAQFGPRQGFTLNGQEYPPDASRAGTMTPAAIAQQLGNVSSDTRRIMIEAEFQRSAAPGQFVDEFRRQVMSGNSPLPAGESLDLLRQLEGRARATESARRTAANAARARVQEDTNTRINAFVEMTEAGVPVAIPQAERQQILAALSPYPELQREALEKFAVADAAVVTHGMAGPELLAYVDAVRGDVQASVERGELDMEGVAVIQSLEDRVSKVQDAITAEMVGLPMIEQLAMDGATADEVDYDALREQAAGNADVIAQINEVEAFHRDIEAIRYMSADEREAALEVARSQLAELAAQGERYGAPALMTQKVVDRLAEWSDHRQGLASSDAVAFAEAAGIDLPSFEGAEGLGQVGDVLSQRIAAVQPSTMAEGVENPVPLTRSEVDGLTDIYRDSPRGEQMAFLGSIAALGEDQANAVFAKIGASEPTLFAAGTVYTGGNHEAASVILRGAVDTKLEGGGPADLATARQGALGDMLEADMLRPDSIAQLDAAALAYARGLAMIDGGRAIDPGDIEEGFEVALGRQSDGTGGVVSTEYGMTLVPSGWVGSHGIMGGDSQSLEAAINSIDDAKLTELARGLVTDRFGRMMGAEALLRSIEGLRPSPDDPHILVPIDADGGVFLTDSGGGHIPSGILQFDLRELAQ